MQVFFMSFREGNCETNWQRCKELHPDAIRIHGVKGIHKVHLICEELAETEYYWTIDGDNWLTEKLRVREIPETDLTLFRTIDPLWDNETTLGSVKLWRKGTMINKDMSKGDFTLNATTTRRTYPKVVSISKYNEVPFDAWKTSFRHCVKMLTCIFNHNPEYYRIDHYLSQWKNSCNSTAVNSNWAYKGYLDAIEYAKMYDNNLPELNKINDYDWLESYYKSKYENN